MHQRVKCVELCKADSHLGLKGQQALGPVIGLQRGTRFAPQMVLAKTTL